MNKYIWIPVLSLAVVGTLALSTVTVFAQSKNNLHPTLVQRLAQHFGVQESEVEQVFNENRQAHHDEMQTNIDGRLSQLVTDGKLTETQKQAILAKHEELFAQMTTDQEQFRSMTPEERKAAIDARRQALETWAQENQIDLSLVPFLNGHHFGHGRGWGMRG